MKEYNGIKEGDIVKVGSYDNCICKGFFYRGDEVQILYIYNGSLLSCRFKDWF